MAKETFKQQCCRLNDRFNERPIDCQLPMELRQMAIAKLCPPHVIASKARAYCSHCGSQVSVLTQKECPVCHSKWGEPEHVDRCSRYSAYEYLCIMSVMEHLQVLRFWYVGMHFRPGQQTRYDVVEVERQFIRSDGSRQGFAMAKPMNYFGQYDAWRWNSEITWKNLTPSYTGYYGDTTTPRFDLPCALTVIKSVIPMLRRNGLKTTMHGAWHPASLCVGLLKNPAIETLWKQGQWAAAEYRAINGGEYTDEVMNALRICTRHHYRIRDIRTWVDHIRLLQQENLDIRNPHYICPKDLQKAHDELNARIRRRQERQEIQRREASYAKQLTRLGKEKKAYAERMGRLLTLQLKGTNLRIRPLQSVDEFAEEGIAMHHCVFAAGYYKHKDTLILSAKDAKGKRLATIEYCISRGSIEQCRAAHNQRPARDTEIRKLITTHRNDFVKLLKAA